MEIKISQHQKREKQQEFKQVLRIEQGIKINVNKKNYKDFAYQLY